MYMVYYMYADIIHVHYAITCTFCTTVHVHIVHVHQVITLHVVHQVITLHVVHQVITLHVVHQVITLLFPTCTCIIIVPIMQLN